MHTLILPCGVYMKFSLPTWTRLSIALIVVLASSYSMNAQQNLTSPYSIFGPGVPFMNQTVSQAGVGGSGVALYDLYKLNLANPAAMALHSETIFETSGFSSFATYNTNTGTYDNNSFILNNLSLNFPIIRGKWGLGIGLVPTTVVGYNITSSIDDPDLGTSYTTNYNGDGGISQGYIGSGYRLIHKFDSTGNPTTLAIGAKLNYNFGTIDNNRKLYFPDDPSSLGVNIKESTLVRDFNAEFGVHFHHNLIKHTDASGRYLRFLAGVTYSLGGDVNAQQNTYSYTFRGTTGLSALDTLESSQGVKGQIHIPSTITLGVGLIYMTSQKARYRFSLDYSTQNWQNYDVSFNDESLQHDFENDQRISGGIEYTPMMGSTKYFRTVEYRAGFYYQNTNLELRGVPIVDRGMSFGVSLPVNHRRGITKSTFNISTQYGKNGTTDEGLIREDYWRLLVGFSFTPHFRNRWFVKPKYD